MQKKFRILLSPILLPLSLIYGFIIFIRNKLFDFNILQSRQFDIPVISVGNITVGGTGKTPHIEYLVSLLKDEIKLATLSRGYKRKTDGFILSSLDSTDRDIGDEPRQIKQKFPDIDVAVDADRVNGILQLLKNNNNLILLDDAYQHRKVSSGLSILLIDYNRPLYKDFIMPLGMLREQAFEKKRADIIIVTKCPSNLIQSKQNNFVNKLKANSSQQVYFTCFDYGGLKPVFNTTASNGENLKNNSILLLTGIANPKSLREYVKTYISSKIESMQYPDHYDFKDADIEKIQQKFNSINSANKNIITTEKDAMRLQKFSSIDNELKNAFYYVPIRVKFLNDQQKSFNKLVFDYVRKN